MFVKAMMCAPVSVSVYIKHPYTYIRIHRHPGIQICSASLYSILHFKPSI